MEKKKPVTKKVVAKKPKVELVSYAIKMVIPTDDYANIQPEIIVKAGSVEEAHDYIAPHMNKLWKDYYLVNQRRPEPVKPKSAPVTEKVDYRFRVTESDVTNQSSPASSVALVKATSAIESCLSLEAMDLIRNRINKSVKLTEADKAVLNPLADNKTVELTEKFFNEPTPEKTETNLAS